MRVPQWPKPRIFVSIEGRTPWGDYLGFAVAQDGTGLAGHCSSSEAFVRHDMGITSDWKHDKYAAHYPGGYTLEWVPLEGWRNNAAFVAALEAAAVLDIQEPTP